MNDYYTLEDIFKEFDDELNAFLSTPYTKPESKPKTVKEEYSKIADEIREHHHHWTNRTLAFYQGAAWALANLDAECEQDYIVMCESVDRRLQ